MPKKNFPNYFSTPQYKKHGVVHEVSGICSEAKGQNCF